MKHEKDSAKINLFVQLTIYLYTDYRQFVNYLSDSLGFAVHV